METASKATATYFLNFQEEDQHHRHLDEWKKYDWDIIVNISHHTGAFAVLGSLTIIVTVLLSCRRRSLTYHRLFLVLSMYDFFQSFFLFMGEWLQPKTYCWDADCSHIGTIGTCSASGFFVQLGAIAIPLYNAAIVTYYTLVLLRKWRMHYELKFHISTFLLTFILALIPLVLGHYNPYYWFCTNSPWGWDNEKNDFARGNIDSMMTYATINLVVVSCVSLYLLAIIAFTFYQMSGGILARGRVAGMAILYTIPFYITWFIPAAFLYVVLGQWYGYEHLIQLKIRTLYIAQVWVATFMPLQGFFNALIYFVPFCLRYNKQNPQFVIEAQNDAIPLRGADEEAASFVGVFRWYLGLIHALGFDVRLNNSNDDGNLPVATAEVISIQNRDRLIISANDSINYNNNDNNDNSEVVETIAEAKVIQVVN